MLEEGSFRGRTADFVFMFIYGGFIMAVSFSIIIGAFLDGSGKVEMAGYCLNGQLNSVVPLRSAHKPIPYEDSKRMCQSNQNYCLNGQLLSAMAQRTSYSKCAPSFFHRSNMPSFSNSPSKNLADKIPIDAPQRKIASLLNFNSKLFPTLTRLLSPLKFLFTQRLICWTFSLSQYFSELNIF